MCLSASLMKPNEISLSKSPHFLPRFYRLCASILSFSDSNTSKMRAPGNGMKSHFFLLSPPKASIQFVQRVCKEMETEFMAVRKEEKQLRLIAFSQITQNCLDIT